MSARNPLGNLDVNDGELFYFPILKARGNNAMEGHHSTAAESLKNTGRWTEWEKLAFLKGLRLYGRGNWKKISDMIPTRYVHAIRDTPDQQSHYLVVASAVIMLTKFPSTLLFNIRHTIQVKTHAQVLLKKYDEGEYIYDELDRHNRSHRQFRQQQQISMAPVPILPRIFNNRPAAMLSFTPAAMLSFPRPDEVNAALALLLLSGEKM
jgi:hypothetical protein